MLLAAACARSGAAARRLRALLPEMLSYAALAGGLLLLLAWAGYGYRSNTAATFEQGRYLLPLMRSGARWWRPALLGFGRRVGPVAAVTLVLLAARLTSAGG